MAFTKEIVDLSRLTHWEIQQTLADLNIPLTVEEAQKIQNDILQRPPSLAELVLFSIEGSEHCSYKSSRSHLKQFTTSGPNVVLGAQEDAGVITIARDDQGKDYCLVISHESHNHPSQIVPYEGAATGIGGNVRDVACMGAEVIAVADGLRFGDITLNKTKWIHEGVVAGIAGYGNPLGIPNLGGDLYYDAGYNDNCLVTIVTLGIVRKDDLIHSYAPAEADNYDIILVGKATDNSGFGGASFASLELEEEKKDQNKGAVQEPNAFLERHLLKASYALFAKLKNADLLDKIGFKDLGAGGVACASVELAEAAGYGAEIWLDQVHVGMDNLHPSVILCSETQERFMWVSAPEVTAMILDHYNTDFNLPEVSENAQARVIGKIRTNQQYVVHSGEEEIVNALAGEVTRGFQYERPVQEPTLILKEPAISESGDFNQTLLQLLAHENIASRSPVYEMYDKQVQGRTVVEAGRGDAGVIAPFNDRSFPKEIRNLGVVLTTDHNPRFGKISPYWAAVNAVAEALRNVAATGAAPQAVTDCLCFGNPEKPKQMWEFAESVRGVADACNKFHLVDQPNDPIPIVAGNVSFYNESRKGPIPASPVISCVGKISDVSNALPMKFQSPDSVIALVGARKDECGGSVYYSLYNELGKNLPRPDIKELERQIIAILDAANEKFILSAHDISEGGVAVALAEMTFNGSIGINITLPDILPINKLLFSETGGFILEIPAASFKSCSAIFDNRGADITMIGKTIPKPELNVQGVISLSIDAAETAWRNGLRDKLL